MREPLRQEAKLIAARERWGRHFVGLAGLLVLAAAALRALTRVMDGDFKLHWEFGRRFLAGDFLYTGGLHLPYPSFWAMAHAPAALVSLPVAKALLFPVGVAALLFLLWTLRRLATSAFQLEPRHAFWAATIALLLAGRYILRDMAELGVNTALVALSWLAIYLWRERREMLAGSALGFAIALKCTPAIFAGYFLWKRQWRMFAISSAAALLLTVAPMLWQGPTAYRDHMAFWGANVWHGFDNVNPSVGVLGPEPLQNMALRPTLARYLMALPEGHPGRVEHRLYADVFDLSPAAAGWIIKGVMLILLAIFLWWSRRAVVSRHEPRLLWELAALSILMLLFSPITWGQHSVALLPASYFVATLFLARGPLPRWMLALLALFVLFVPILSRDLVGRDFAALLASYHVETFAIIGLFCVVLGAARHERLLARP